MNTGVRLTRPADRGFNIGLGVVFALGIVFTTFMLVDSWGGASWVFGSAVSIIVGGLTLMRERQTVRTAVAGLAVTAVAVVVSLITGDELPQEPAPITALALSVLVGSAIRTLPMGPAVGIAVGGVVVTGVTWFDGWSGVTSLATMGMAAALVMGPTLRGLDRNQRANAPAPQGVWVHPRGRSVAGELVDAVSAVQSAARTAGLPAAPNGVDCGRGFGNLINVIVPDRWFRVVSTVGLGVAFLAAIAIQSFALAQTWGDASWAPGGAAAVVVCALALMRHRGRTWTAAAGLAVTALAVLLPLLPGTRFPAGLGPAVALGLAVLTGSAVRALPTVRAGAIAGAGLLVIAAQFAVRPPSAVPAIAAAAWLAAVGVGLSLRMFDGRAQATAEEVRRAERLELARELHDIVAHHITGMLIQAQAAHIVARRAPEKVSDSLTEIETAGSEAMAAMRRVVGLLRDADDAAPASPGPEGLRTLVGRFSRQGPKLRLSVPDDDTDWPPEVTSTVYRIVQEALTNVLRHARHARSIDVTVGRDTEAVTVEVADDAPSNSARPHHQRGYGLIGMRERVEALGGSLCAGPRPGVGWSVRATLPVPTREPG